ncbi:MAG: hypothetical protein Q8R15_00020 [Candidatus Micrarchaeota archaeon]|nr:hypothetical protein [Candidatus Micrarchaeota archaeon]
MAKFLIKRFFAGRKYPSVAAIMRHAQEISAEITAATTPEADQLLTDFEKQVNELALKHLHGQYDVKRIAAEMPMGEATGKVLLSRIGRALIKLKESGLIPRTTRQEKPQYATKLREVTPAEVNDNMGLVHYVLKGNRFIPGDWRKHISYNRALEIGKEGLARGMEIRDPDKGNLSTIAIPHIATRIAREVKRVRKIRSLDANLPDQERTLHDITGVPAVDPVMFENKLDLLVKSRLAKPHHIGVYVLRQIYGHSPKQIAQHFKVSRQAVDYVYKSAVKIISRKQQE